jgi:hypothetical protein
LSVLSGPLSTHAADVHNLLCIALPAIVTRHCWIYNFSADLKTFSISTELASEKNQIPLRESQAALFVSHAIFFNSEWTES